MNKILWLASWYPNRLDTLTGDFIERHALAASQYDQITVLFAVRDRSLRPGKTKEDLRAYNGRCTARILYYNVRNGLAWWGYWKYMRRLLRAYLQSEGKPLLVHVHVCFRAGLLALYLLHRFGIPYIVSEHWSAFQDAAPRGYSDFAWWKRQLIRLIFRRAAMVVAVSRSMAVSLSCKMGIVTPKVIANVVDTTLFYPQRKDNKVFHFIHVSQLNHAKNAEQIIAAAKQLAEWNDQFRLTIVGPYQKDIAELAKHPNIVYLKEMPQPELAAEVRGQDALILYSRYEGLPCVVIEAMACGIPVIGSDIPALQELIIPGENGVLVPIDQPQVLAREMLSVMQGNYAFDARTIALRAREKYNPQAVGLQFQALYRSLLGPFPNEGAGA